MKTRQTIAELSRIEVWAGDQQRMMEERLADGLCTDPKRAQRDADMFGILSQNAEHLANVLDLELDGVTTIGDGNAIAYMLMHARKEMDIADHYAARLAASGDERDRYEKCRHMTRHTILQHAANWLIYENKREGATV